MKLQVKPVFMMAVYICGGGAFVWSDERPLPLTWSDCVAIASQRNPDLAASRAGTSAAAAAYRGSFNGLLPGVNLSNSYSDSKGATAPLWQTQVSAALTVFDVSTFAGIRSASASLAQSEARQRQASALLRLNLRRAFLRRLFDDKDIDVSRNVEEIRRKSAQLVTLRYQSGRESKGNKLRADAQLLEATSELTQAIRRVRSDQRVLSRQLGLEEGSDRSVRGELEAAAPSELPARMRDIVDRRPDVLLQEAELNVARANVDQARGSLWPTLTAGYSQFRSGESEFPSGERGWTARGALTYPLFAEGPTAAANAIAASRRNMEKATLNLQSVREEALADLETSWSAYAAASDQTRVQAALLAAARQRNDEADVRYNSGLLTYDNWEIIVTDRVNQERQTIQAQLAAATAQAVWENALGKTLEE